MAVRVIYRYLVRPGREKEFIEAWKRETRATRSGVKGNKGGLLTHDARDPLVYWSIMRWESMSALETHRRTDLPESESAKAMQSCLAGAVSSQICEELADLTVV